MAHAGHEVALGTAQDLQLLIALLELMCPQTYRVLELAAVAQLTLTAPTLEARRASWLRRSR